MKELATAASCLRCAQEPSTTYRQNARPSSVKKRWQPHIPGDHPLLARPDGTRLRERRRQPVQEHVGGARLVVELREAREHVGRSHLLDVAASVVAAHGWQRGRRSVQDRGARIRSSGPASRERRSRTGRAVRFAHPSRRAPRQDSPWADESAGRCGAPAGARQRPSGRRLRRSRVGRSPVRGSWCRLGWPGPIPAASSASSAGRAPPAGADHVASGTPRAETATGVGECLGQQRAKLVERSSGTLADDP